MEQNSTLHNRLQYLFFFYIPERKKQLKEGDSLILSRKEFETLNEAGLILNCDHGGLIQGAEFANVIHEVDGRFEIMFCRQGFDFILNAGAASSMGRAKIRELNAYGEGKHFTPYEVTEGIAVLNVAPKKIGGCWYPVMLLQTDLCAYVLREGAKGFLLYLNDQNKKALLNGL